MWQICEQFKWCAVLKLIYLEWYIFSYDKVNSETLKSALAEGPKSVEYTYLVEWLSKELQLLCSLDEHVNAITGPEDASNFLLEVSSFLKELGMYFI